MLHRHGSRVLMLVVGVTVGACARGHSGPVVPPMLIAQGLHAPVPRVANLGVTTTMLAALADGTEVAAWVEEDGYGNRLLVARLDQSGTWSTPRAIDADVAQPTLVNGAGGALLAWAGSRSAYVSPTAFAVRVARFVGGAFENPVTLGVLPNSAASLGAVAGPAGLAIAVGLLGAGPAVALSTHDGTSWSALQTFGTLGTWSMGGVVLPESATVSIASSATEHCAVASIIGSPSRALANVFAAGTWAPTVDLFDGRQIGRVKGLASDGARFCVLADSNGPGRVRVRAAGVWGLVTDLGERDGVLAASGGTFLSVSRRVADGVLLAAIDSGAGFGATTAVAGSSGSLDETPALAIGANTGVLAWRSAADTLAASTLQGGVFTAPVVLASGGPALDRVRATNSMGGFAVTWAANALPASTVVRAEYVAGSWQAPLSVPVPHAGSAPAALAERSDGFSALLLEQPVEHVVRWSGLRRGAFVPSQRLSSAAPVGAPVWQNSSPRIAVDGSGNVFVAWAEIDSSRTVRRVVARQTSGNTWRPPVAVTEPMSTGAVSFDVALSDTGFLVAHDMEAHSVVLRSAVTNWAADLLATTGGASGFHGVRTAASASNVAVAWLENGEKVRGGLWAAFPGVLGPKQITVGADTLRVGASSFPGYDIGNLRMQGGAHQVIVANSDTSLIAHQWIQYAPYPVRRARTLTLDATNAPLLGVALVTVGDMFLAAWTRPGLVATYRSPDWEGQIPPWSWVRAGEISGSPAVAAGGGRTPVVGWIEGGAPWALAQNAGGGPFLLDTTPGTTRAVAVAASPDLVSALLDSYNYDYAWARENADGTTTIVARSNVPLAGWLSAVTIATTAYRVVEIALAPTSEGFTVVWEESGDIHAAVRIPRR